MYIFERRWDQQRAGNVRGVCRRMRIHIERCDHFSGYTEKQWPGMNNQVSADGWKFWNRKPSFVAFLSISEYQSTTE